MRIDDQFHALITGGVGGIGLAVAEVIISRGGHVFLVDYSEESKGQSVVSLLNQRFGSKRAFFYRCDVSNEKQLAACFSHVVKQFGSLQFVFNNAGIGERTTLKASLKQDEFPKDWEQTIAINLTAVINGTRLAIAHHKSTSTSDALVIINTASLGGLLPMNHYPVYCATKYAVVGYSRSLNYLSSRGIRVNALCPGFTDTALVHAGNEANPQQATVVAASGPLLTTTQIAEAAIMMIEDPAFVGDVVTITNQLGIAKHRPTPLHTNKTQITYQLKPLSKL